MSYKFVKVTTHYPAYLDDYYSHNPEVEKWPYQQQYEHLMADAFGWADFFAKNLKNLGVDAVEIIANSDPLQNRWAKEHGVKKEGKALVIEQLKALKPNVVLFENPFVHNGHFIREVRAQVQTIKQYIGHCCAVYTPQQIQQMNGFDYMLACNPGILSEFVKLGIRAYRLNQAFEHSLLPVIKNDNDFQETDIFFAGSLNLNHNFENKREKFLNAILNSDIRLRMHTSITEESPAKLLLKQGMYICNRMMNKARLALLANHIPVIRKASSWPRFPRKRERSREFISSIHPPLYGINMLKALYKSKVGFNIDIDDSEVYSGSMRMFEVTGVGSCLITEHKTNIGEFFKPDDEIVTYTCMDECIEKIRWLLDHPTQRKAIANSGQQRTLCKHTYKQRALELNSIISDELR